MADDPAGGSSRIRQRPRRGFTHLPNETVRDPELSLAAKGLLAILLSLPDGWVYRLGPIQEMSRNGRDATRSALAELITAGYVTRVPARREDGRVYGWDYEISDTRPGAAAEAQPAPENAVTDASPPSHWKPVRRRNRQTEKPPDGKPDAIKKDLKNKDLTNKEGSGGSAAAAPSGPVPDHHPLTEKKLRQAFGRLLDQLLLEDPRRRRWYGLDGAQLVAAITAAQASVGDGQTFATALKGELDKAIGIHRGPAPAAEPMTEQQAAELQRRRALATEASERAYAEALDGGLSKEQAQAAYTAAYERALRGEAQLA